MIEEMQSQRRRLGSSELLVGPVGMGTCQLRLKPRETALATLRAAYHAGINLFHTSPDYEGALEVTLEAFNTEVEDRPVILHQGYGPMPHFRHLYGQALASEPAGRLPIYGIACVEDREAVGEDVFGPNGMIAFLKAEKAAGRLGSVFCTTHAGPEGMRRYLETGAFDAAMIAYNPLGYHLLTYNGGNQREFENMEQIREEIFPLALRLDVGLMIMKPLAGGLLTKGKAFPSQGEVRPPITWSAREVLEWILSEPAVSCVIPGMADPAEVWENVTPTGRQASRDFGMNDMRRTLCSRCGACESTCSQHLPVSWLFRDGYIQLYPSETFETPPEMRFARLHPEPLPTCISCSDQSCHCPQGIAIPRELPRLHLQWSQARERFVAGEWITTPDIEVIEPRIPKNGGPTQATLYIRNRSGQAWESGEGLLHTSTGKFISRTTHRVHPEETTHLVWTLPESQGLGPGRATFAWNGGPPIRIGEWK